MRQAQVIVQEPILKDTNAPQLQAFEFDRLIKDYGYTVVIERALKCPCNVQGFNAPQSTCTNCFGSGWYFYNPIQTVLVLQSMNANRKFENWSEENAGTVQITARFIDRISFMDRITLIDATHEFTQILNPFEDKNKTMAYTIYPILDVSAIFMFVDNDKALKPLVLNTDYTFVNQTITFNKKYNNKERLSVSLRYKHKPQYHAIDIPRDIMLNNEKDCNDDIGMANFPVKVIGRIAHNVIADNSITIQ